MLQSAKLYSLPIGRQLLAWALFAFISVFALTDSLRMASIIAADQATGRAERPRREKDYDGLGKHAQWRRKRHVGEYAAGRGVPHVDPDAQREEAIRYDDQISA
jgi:hypothetical protein